MSVAPFPTLARAVSRITAELWIGFLAPVRRGALESAEVAPSVHALDGRDAAAHAADLIDAWLAIDELVCCHLQLGLQLYVDGALWTGGTTDHFGHLGGWAQLGLDLLDGKPSSTWVWDESALRTRIEGERAMVWDEHALRVGRRDAWWPIRVERVAMARAIAEGGARIDALRTAVIGALDARTDRRSLPRFDVAGAKPRARDERGKLAVIDHEIARSSDMLAFRELASRLRSLA